MAWLFAWRAAAVSLTLVDTEVAAPGVTWHHYTTTSPTTHTWVAEIDLCAEGVRVEASRASTSLRSTGTWAGGEGLVAAINADFYKTDPVRVYGRAVGDGATWPLEQTGADPAYASEWYYQDYGWVAFGHDQVWYTHTRQVKTTRSGLGGYAPTEVGAAPPPGALQLVSGFPELVIEGERVDCPSPTDSSCFPDRSDMRERHPRTAVGLTADLQTLLWVVVDGRTGISSGMYGEELAEVMAELGAYVAFNLDGGGSSQLWVDDEGYVNDASGNNFGSGYRSVANHLGVDVEAGRAAHCRAAPSCGPLGPGGGLIDNRDPCFVKYGRDIYWRSESLGHDGHLYWTNAWNSEAPDNWAWWRTEPTEAGTYRVEVYVEPSIGVYDAVRYEVRAAGETHVRFLDQGAASGWTALGSFAFAAGPDQWVAVYDDLDGSVPADQHIAVDAVQLIREDPWCGDGQCDPGERPCPADCPPLDTGRSPAETGTLGETGVGVDPPDTAPPPETALPAETAAPGPPSGETAGAAPRLLPERKAGGCATSSARPGLELFALLLLVGRRAWRARRS